MPCVLDLIELLKKISKSTDKVHLEVNYDGREMKWEVTRRNLTASEWVPAQLKSDEGNSRAHAQTLEANHSR
jgi:hypothetical protein